MKVFMFKLLDAFGEILVYFAILTYFMLAMIIALTIPKWFPVCAIASFLIYLFKHHTSKKGKEDEE